MCAGLHLHEGPHREQGGTQAKIPSTIWQTKSEQVLWGKNLISSKKNRFLDGRTKHEITTKNDFKKRFIKPWWLT